MGVDILGVLVVRSCVELLLGVPSPPFFRDSEWMAGLVVPLPPLGVSECLLAALAQELLLGVPSPPFFRDSEWMAGCCGVPLARSEAVYSTDLG